MEYIENSESIQLVDAGKIIAEITFPIKDGAYELNHTFVDESLRGKGIAGELVKRAVTAIRARGGKARPVCSYAVKWFNEHPDEVTDIIEIS